ncbi:MAG: c-type cytochrome, partial [Terriglobia bacterium]
MNQKFSFGNLHPAKRRLAALIAIAVIGSFAHSPRETISQTDRLSPQERRGQNIYLGLGDSSDPPIKALIGDPPTEAEGALMACANCHGKDGRGKPEGGVVPSDITWQALTRPYTVTHPGGRTHPV